MINNNHQCHYEGDEVKLVSKRNPIEAERLAESISSHRRKQLFPTAPSPPWNAYRTKPHHQLHVARPGADKAPSWITDTYVAKPQLPQRTIQVPTSVSPS